MAYVPFPPCILPHYATRCILYRFPNHPCNRPSHDPLPTSRQMLDEFVADAVHAVSTVFLLCQPIPIRAPAQRNMDAEDAAPPGGGGGGGGSVAAGGAGGAAAGAEASTVRHRPRACVDVDVGNVAVTAL